MRIQYLGAIAIASMLTIGTVSCAGTTNPCAGATKEEEVDPCAGADPCAAKPCAGADPCAGDPCAADPCAGDPCAAAKEGDPCAADPCAGS